MWYSFVAITPRSTLTQSGSTCFIYWSNRSVWKLLVLDWNTWYHITVQTNYYYYYYHHHQIGIIAYNQIIVSLVGWGCKIHRLHLCRGVNPSPTPNKYPGYDTKQFDGEVSVMLELWGMWSTPSLPLLPSLLWPGVVVPDRVLSMA